jgi:hypothetical protein
LLAKLGWNATPRRPLSPLESTVNCTNGVATAALFLTTWSEPPCSATNKRPSGACAKATALFSPVIHASSLVKPGGTVRLPPTRTVDVDHADTLPAASRARARTTCWPLG